MFFLTKVGIIQHEIHEQSAANVFLREWFNMAYAIDTDLKYDKFRKDTLMSLSQIKILAENMHARMGIVFIPDISQMDWKKT